LCLYFFPKLVYFVQISEGYWSSLGNNNQRASLETVSKWLSAVDSGSNFSSGNFQNKDKLPAISEDEEIGFHDGNGKSAEDDHPPTAEGGAQGNDQPDEKSSQSGSNPNTTANGTSFRISIEFRSIEKNRSHHDMIAVNLHDFLQQLASADNSLQLQLLDWKEGEIKLVPIDALISKELEIEYFNRLGHQFNKTLRPSMKKIVAITVQLWSHQGYWGINKSREKLREYTLKHNVVWR
jgi:hypothetical protein